MKKIINCLLLLSTGLMFAQTLKGTIENSPKEMNFSLRHIGEKTIKKITVDKGMFEVENLNLEEGYYKLRNGNDTTYLYLKPDDELIISFDAENFDKTLKFSGKGAERNTFLFDKVNLQVDRKEDTNAFYEGSENDYKTKIELIHSDIKKLLNKIPDEDFKKKELINLKYSYLIDIFNYQHLLKYYFGKEITVSESFLTPLKDINFKDSNLYSTCPSYKNLASMKWNRVIKRASTFEEMDDVFRSINDNKIMFDVLINAFYRISDTPKKSKDYLKLIKKYIKNKEFLSQAKEAYNKAKATSNGKKSPNFKYENSKGENIELKSFKGKYVFIDVWATWCVPCMKQIPYLKKLEKKYHDKNIVFVGISVDKKEQYKLWKATVKEKGLEGVQLFADNSFQSDFIEAFSINSIPRFILISPEGKIIDNNFSKPSHKKTEETLDSLLTIK